MPTYFLDSSALVKAYRREEGTQRLLDLLRGSDPLVVSRLAHVEVSSAIVRRGRATGIPTQDLNAVQAELDREIAESFQVIEFATPVLARAVELTGVHGLRAADAIQLACALSALGETPPHEFTVVGSDQELNAAASAEGLSVLDPTRP
jgi:predicted nucleic acid-binding protein